MQTFGLCQHGMQVCMGKREGCAQSPPVVDSITWNESSTEMIAAARCGISAILVNMHNQDLQDVAPRRYPVGKLEEGWCRSLFGIFPRQCANSQNPLFVNGVGEAIRYDRPSLVPARSPSPYLLFKKKLESGRIKSSSALNMSIAAFSIVANKKSLIYLINDIHKLSGRNEKNAMVDQEVTSLALSNNGKSLAYGTSDGSVYINRSVNGNLANFRKIPESLTGPVSSISWSSCDTAVGFCAREASHVLFHLPSGGNAPPLPQPGAVAIDVGTNYQKVAVRLRNGQTVIWSRANAWSAAHTFGKDGASDYPDLGAIKFNPANDKVATYAQNERAISVHHI